MTNTETIKLDDNGIPVLENPVTPESLQAATPVAGPDLTDTEVVARLLQSEQVQQLMNDMADDLQKLVSWKIESLVKEQVTQLITQATEESAPKLAEDIRTQLQLALPGLLANLVEQSREL